MSRIYRGSSPQASLFHFSGFIEAIPASERRLQRISKVGNLEQFRSVLEAAVDEDRIARGGRPCNQLKPSGRRGFDAVFMLKCLMAQRVHDQGDEQFHTTMCSDLLVQDFLGINDPNDVPSAKTLWKYREIFAKNQVFKNMFDSQVAGFVKANPSIGTVEIIDSSFVEAPKQRNTREENKIIKEGNGDSLWKDKPNKKRHKDIDASWTKKRQEVHFGYKSHNTICALSKLIIGTFTTTAKVHDVSVADQMIHLTSNAAILYADAGYVGRKFENAVLSKKMIPLICSKGYKGHPLTEEQKKDNRELSRIRCRVEHPFGFIERTLHGSHVRSVGIMRAAANNYLTSYVYNLFRLCQLTGL